MKEAINESVSTLQVLCHQFSEKYKKNFEIMDRELFVIAVLLSVQEEAIEKKASPEQVMQILYQGFVIDAGENKIVIDGYNGYTGYKYLHDCYLKCLLFYQYITEEEQKKKFMWSMLLYPFLAILEEICPENYGQQFSDIITARGFCDCSVDGMLLQKSECENLVRNFSLIYEICSDVYELQKMLELMEKGYILRSLMLEP